MPNEELHNLQPSQSITAITKNKSFRYVACVREMRNVCRLLAGRVGMGVIVWETHSRREDNIRIHLRE